MFVASLTFALIGAALGVFSLGIAQGWWGRAQPSAPASALAPASANIEAEIEVEAEADPAAPPSPSPDLGGASEAASTDTGDSGDSGDSIDEPSPPARTQARVECEFLVATHAGAKLQARSGRAPKRCDELRVAVTTLGVEADALRLRVDGEVASLRPGQPRRFGADNPCWTLSGELAAKYVSLKVAYGGRCR